MAVGQSQLDHVVVSSAGVHTIETKNYRGTIYGNAEKQKFHYSPPTGLIALVSLLSAVAAVAIVRKRR